MLVRTTVTLLLCTTSTLALAREPARPVYAGGVAPVQLASRTADPINDPDYNDPVYSEPSTTTPTTPSTSTTTTTPLSTPPPQNIRPPKISMTEWERERRKLQAQTAVSWVLTAVGAVGTAVPLAMFRSCKDADQTRVLDCSQERRTAAIAAPIFGALTLASIIPAIVYSTRLARHNRYSGLARFNVTPGGVMLRF